jgi:hypothetical protein
MQILDSVAILTSYDPPNNRWTLHFSVDAVKNLTSIWLGSACMNLDIYSRVTQATKHTLSY